MGKWMFYRTSMTPVAPVAGDVRERHLCSLIEKGQDMIAVLDPKGVILYQSPSAKRTLGYSEDLTGKRAADLAHPDDRLRVIDAIASSMAAPEGAIRVEYRVRTREGSWRDVESILTNAMNDPAVAGILVNSRDVTERKRAP
jgi:PAS domain S-box-containing protein